MNTSEQAESATTRDIDIEYEFRQSPAQVWRVLSEPELVAQWLAPGEITTEAGGPFVLHTATGAVDCVVLDSEPERLLRYSWHVATDAENIDTVVTFVLTETATGGTHLRVIHSGFVQATAQIVPFRRVKPANATLQVSSLSPVCRGTLSWAA